MPFSCGQAYIGQIEKSVEERKKLNILDEADYQFALAVHTTGTNIKSSLKIWQCSPKNQKRNIDKRSH